MSSHDSMRRQLNDELRQSYEKYAIEVEKEEVRKKQDEELYMKARTLSLTNKLISEHTEKLDMDIARGGLSITALKIEIAELRLQCKTSREENAVLKTEMAALKRLVEKNLN